MARKKQVQVQGSPRQGYRYEEDREQEGSYSEERLQEVDLARLMGDGCFRIPQQQSRSAREMTHDYD